MGRPNRGLTDAFVPEDLEQIDWTMEHHPKNHPVRVIVRHQQLYDLTTGALIGTLEPGYRFYWAHQHIHVAPYEWDGKDAYKEMTMGRQTAKPLSPP